jgi:hypothetical protein
VLVAQPRPASLDWSRSPRRPDVRQAQARISNEAAAVAAMIGKLSRGPEISGHLPGVTDPGPVRSLLKVGYGLIVS